MSDDIARQRNMREERKELDRLSQMFSGSEDDMKRGLAAKALEDAAASLDGAPDALMMVHEMPGLLRKRAELIRAGIVEV